MQIFESIKNRLVQRGFNVASYDLERPWGGFFVISEDQAQLFADEFFKEMKVDSLRIAEKLSPKILVVKPGARLSWQYHHRRAETWRVIEGPVGVIRSFSDEEGELASFESGEIVVLQQGERHRLIGLEHWGVVAEFWQHTEPDNPSDEADIVRVQDDYARK